MGDAYLRSNDSDQTERNLSTTHDLKVMGL